MFISVSRFEDSVIYVSFILCYKQSDKHAFLSSVETSNCDVWSRALVGNLNIHFEERDRVGGQMKTTNAIYIHTNTPTTDGVPTSMDNVNKQLLYDTAFFVTLKGGH